EPPRAVEMVHESLLKSVARARRRPGSQRPILYHTPGSLSPSWLPPGSGQAVCHFKGEEYRRVRAGRSRNVVVVPGFSPALFVSAGLDSRNRPSRSAGDLADDQLAVVVGVAVHRLQGLGSLDVEVEVVLPGKADPPVNLDRVPADLSGGIADVRLGHRGGDGRVVCLGIEGP